MTIVCEEIYPWIEADKLTVRPDAPSDVLESIRHINAWSLKNKGYEHFNLTKVNGTYEEASGTGLAATLPENKDVSAALIVELKKKFGARVVVSGGIVLVTDKRRDLGSWTNRPTPDFNVAAEKADVMTGTGTVFDYSALGEDEEKIARFVLSRPSSIRLQGENSFIASRRTDVGEFFVFGDDEEIPVKIRYDGFRPARR